MAHILIVGRTESGKSTLARKIAAGAIKKRRNIAVYDPTLADWGDDIFVTDDEFEAFSEFSEIARAGKGGVVFVDEADTVFGVSHRHNHWLVTRGRHFGIVTVAITQRPVLVSPTVRGMCAEVYVFRVSASDAKLLADDYACPGLLDAVSLQQGHFLHPKWDENGQVVIEHGRVF